MSELSRDALLDIVRDVYERHDPVPEHLVAAMQAAAAMAASDLDLELMTLVDEVWDQLSFRTPWSRGREHEEVRKALTRFVDWHQRPQRLPECH